MSHRHHALAVLVILVLTACTPPDADESPRTEKMTYVALGDSQASGPGITAASTKEPACLRSNRNYPTVLAASLGLTGVKDVSCVGARPKMQQDGRTFGGVKIGPQIDAVGKSTTLVTINTGGVDIYGALFSACLLPVTASDAACRQLVSGTEKTISEKTMGEVSDVLAEIRKRGPKARIFVVGYLRLVPEKGSCAALPLSETRRASTIMVESSFNEALRTVASKAGATFVDVRGISRGHDACAGAEAWVNGIQSTPGDGLYLHPKAVGMQAIAGQALKVIKSS